MSNNAHVIDVDKPTGASPRSTEIATALGTDFPGLALAATPSEGIAASIIRPARIWEGADGGHVVLLGDTCRSPIRTLAMDPRRGRQLSISTRR